MWIAVQYSVAPARSMIPHTTKTPVRADASAIAATSGPSSATAPLEYRRYSSRPASVRRPTGDPNVSPLGYPPMKASGKTASTAPAAAASSSRVTSLATVAPASNPTDPAWTTATLAILVLRVAWQGSRRRR